nr:isopentenyl-diphosphate Delta-isomerase [Nocardia cyriacigeorgica]
MTIRPATAQMIVLCGPDGEAVGYQPKNEVHHQATPLHLAFSCYVFDDSARLLVTRRAYSKQTWPGVLTNSCCGHPRPAEPMAAAVERRVREELGIAVAGTTLVLPTFAYRAEMTNGIVENELCPVFIAHTECGTPHPDPDEVAETAWIPWSDFTARVLGGSLTVSPWCRSQVEQLAPLGADPAAWPVGDPDRLPHAATR